MIVGGIYMIIKPGYYNYDFLNQKKIISGIGLIIVALAYLVSDILILLKKNK